MIDARIDKNLLGMHNGISQQPAPMRLDTQLELQENTLPSLVHGLIKRPPTEHVKALASVNITNTAFVHAIDRDSTERYLVVVTGDATEPIEIYKTLDGTKCTVQYGTLSESMVFTAEATNEVRTYVTDSNPRENFSAVTVADYTIIVNKTKQCKMSTSKGAEQIPTAFFYVKEAMNLATYWVYVDGVEHAECACAWGSGDAELVADSLYDDLVTNIGTDFNLTIDETIVKLTRKNSADFKFKASDTYGDNLILGVKGTIQKLQDLPRKCFDGIEVEVTGEEGRVGDSYYVKYETDGDYSTGTWKETVKGGLYNDFDEYTLPFRIVRTATNTFTVAPILWGSRRVGDTDNAPVPSFIDNCISGVCFYKNRLGFLSGENICLSRSGEFFEFFPKTVMEVLDDDPIDVAASSNKVNTLVHVLPANNILMMISGQQQFALNADKSLTPATAVIDPTTAFEANLICPPVQAGANVLFVCPVGEYSTVREYFIDTDNLVNDAADITAHCPTYIPKNVYQMIVSNVKDTVFVFTTEDPNSIYVYNYYWKGDEKAQSAWHKYTFDYDIYGGAIVGGYLYLVVKRDGDSGVHIEKMSLEKLDTGSLNFTVHLDRLVKLTGVYSDGVTTWTLPYTDSNADDFVVINSSTGVPLTGWTKASSTTITKTGDYSAIDYYIGKNYNQKIQLSEWFYKSSDGSSTKVKGRLIMKKLELGFTDTGYFTVTVKPYGRDPLIHTYVAQAVGDILGDVPLHSQTENFILQCDSRGSTITIENDTYLPCNIYAASLTGRFVSHSRSI